MRTAAGSRPELERLGRSATLSREDPPPEIFIALPKRFRMCKIDHFNRKTVGLDTGFRCVIETEFTDRHLLNLKASRVAECKTWPVPCVTPQDG
jgi:hypothetical protein